MDQAAFPPITRPTLHTSFHKRSSPAPSRDFTAVHVGLHPAFDDSGNSQWTGGIRGHGRKDLRCLLIEAAQSILRCASTPLAKWGRKLMARKGAKNLAVAAVARKLTVAIWYLLMGKATPLEEIDASLALKVGKIIGQVGADGLKQLGKTRTAFREEIYATLKTGRLYVLDPDKTFVPRQAEEATCLA